MTIQKTGILQSPLSFQETPQTSWAGKVWSNMTAQITLANVAKVSMVAAAVIGIATTSSLEGLAIGGAVTALGALALGLASTAKGKCSRIATTLLMAGAASAAFSTSFQVDAHGSTKTLKQTVDEVLADGGTLTRKGSSFVGTSGIYLIKDNKGSTIAIFKPEDEGTWGPNNPNPEYRKPKLSDEDIYFHQVDSWEQGRSPERQSLAQALLIGSATTMPQGAIAEFVSDQFFDIEAAARGEKAKRQTKRGFLQEWVPNLKPLMDYHPSLENWPKEKLPPMTALDFHDNPILDAVSLDEYQQITLTDILTYNEDRNAGNLLVSFNKDGKPSLVPIDSDAILPWKLKSLFGIYTHKKAKEPFTPESLRLIQNLNPKQIRDLVEKMGLSEQAPLNAEILAIVIKRFAASGATLHDIAQFVSFGDREQPTQVSKLWELIEEAQRTAVRSLSSTEKETYLHNIFLRRSIWCETMTKSWCETLPKDERAARASWQEEYKKQAPKINAKIKAQFWIEFNRRLESEIKKLPSCHTLANLCWRTHQLAPGVTHHRYEGRYDGLKQRFEVLKIKRDAKAKLAIQDARGLFKKGETPPYGRLHLIELAARMPGTIAAISGGNFHYIPPKGEFYEWAGSPYTEGDPVGELVVNGKVLSKNPKEFYWGAFTISSSGETSFVDTFTAKDKKTSSPKYSIGAVPMLIKDGIPITTAELGPALALKPKQAPLPGIQFRSHINMQHARAGVCKTKEGDHLLVIVEGKQKEAEGLRMAQFARFLKSLDCEDALNLDGGGTADLVTKDKDGKFISSITPSDSKGKRPVTSAIVISAT